MGNIHKKEIVRTIGLGCAIDTNRGSCGSDKERNGRTDRTDKA